MKISKKSIFIIIIVLLVLSVIVLVYFQNRSKKDVPSGKYSTFAICLKEKGAVFYGAWWCPHCNNTKALFGDGKDLLPYIECSTPDGKEQIQVCKDKKITGYPTWEFADGSRLDGEVKLEDLAVKTSCLLP